MEASLGDDVDLDGWVPSRVVDRARVDLSDGHRGWDYGVSGCQGRIEQLKGM